MRNLPKTLLARTFRDVEEGLFAVLEGGEEILFWSARTDAGTAPDTRRPAADSDSSLSPRPAREQRSIEPGDRVAVVAKGPTMRRDYIGVIERLACAVSHGTIHPAVTVQSGGSSRRLSDHALDTVHAAGACRHWGVSLIRLKYANDASEFRACLAKFRELSDDDELTQFLAHDVLLGWLLDRRIRGRGEWATKCQNLRRKINSEALEASSIMALKLGSR